MPSILSHPAVPLTFGLGLAVLLSELQWVWLPAIALVLLNGLWRLWRLCLLNAADGKS
ncbi:hypothetical protein ACFOKJ_10965 [Vogesella amnigena]|uniref:Uncharacterized protein n=1 Tax=Vogesella amnigena TaxID=1507449 RepID=A0ABV7TV39_9NEIS